MHIKRPTSGTSEYINSTHQLSIQSGGSGRFLYIKIHKVWYEIINMIVAGTNYGYCTIFSSRSVNFIRNLFHTAWFYNHRASRWFRTDHEFCRPVFFVFLSLDGIELSSRPTRSSYKLGRFELNNGLFKSIMEWLECADPLVLRISSSVHHRTTPPDLFDESTIGHRVPWHRFPNRTTGRLLVVSNYESR